ncbi:MAG: pilus assembly protein [Gemmataceae bacterium]|nr:pilus assembly protein [Gemmataceae bacterium]
MLFRRSARFRRTASVAVELVVLLPILMFFAIIGVDYARIFSRIMILETASRNACLYAAEDPIKAYDTVGIEVVARKDMTDISPETPTTVTIERFTGTDGFNYVKVTVSITFKTVTNFPGVPSQSQLNRSTHMRVCPTTPKPGTF